MPCSRGDTLNVTFVMVGRRARFVVVVALLAASCTSEADPTTTGGPTSTSVPLATTTTEDPLLRLALPFDPDIVHGELENGLVYYIKENDSPGGRAELRLLVEAGSVQEDDDQAGMAHFLEHMMFNGTERFPRNELITVLEAFGPRFGPDINAYTSYDETVYELSLTTDDGDLVELGVEVLREWATRATLTEADVADERGVILDEWRLRAQGYGARLTEQLQELVLTGTVYEDRDPIGTDDSIVSTSRDELARFYEDWYHPARMALVAVGDFEVDDVESLIVDAFSDLAIASDPRGFDLGEYTPPAEPRVAVYVDEEATTGEILMIWPKPARSLQTAGDYQELLAMSFGLEILVDRLNDDASVPETPLLGAAPVDFDWTRTLSVRGVDVELRSDQMTDGLENVLTEIERLRRYGVSQGEFERSRDGYAAFSEQIYAQQDSIQDAQIAAEIVEHHLGDAPLMSASQRFDVESDILARLNRHQVNEALLGLLDSHPAIFVVAPDDPGLEIPDEAEILSVWSGLTGLELQDRAPVAPGPVDLMVAPDAVDPITVTVDPRFEYTTLEFANGATVYVWESEISRESIHAQIEGFGGTSLVALEDLPEAFLMTDIVGRSGVGDFDFPTLRRLLADRIVDVFPWVSETRQGLEADASVTDVETMFQLIHLTLTEPRFDEVAVDAVLDDLASINASRTDLPDILFEEALKDAYYGDDPRYFVLPDDEQLAAFDVTTAGSIYDDLFGNAANFAFAFVGDLDTEIMVDLASTYIGTLPGRPPPAGFVDNQPLPPRRVQLATVQAGAGNQGQVGLFFTNEFNAENEDRVTARLVELILSARLRERVREELGATYSITAGIDLQDDPDAFAESFVLSTGDPEGLEVISREVLAAVERLQTEGPSEAQFATAQEQLRDELELIDNWSLAQALITAHLYPDQPVADFAQRYFLVDEITREDVRKLASAVFDLAQRIEIRQVPRG